MKNDTQIELFLLLTIQEVELWEASSYGQLDRVCDLLKDVNVDASDMVSISTN